MKKKNKRDSGKRKRLKEQRKESRELTSNRKEKKIAERERKNISDLSRISRRNGKSTCC